MNERLERAPVGVLEATPDGTVTGINDAARDLLEVEEPVTGSHVETVVPASVDDVVPSVFEDGRPAEASAEEYYPSLNRWISVSVVPGGEAVTVFLQDESPLRAEAQANERLQGELERLTVLNGVVSAVLEDLVGASSRAEVAETVCERLGETELYEFAWFGEREVGGDDVVVRASAGETGRTFERVRESLGESTTPESRAVETGETQVVQPIAEAEAIPEPVRRAAFADGVQSLLAIPLTYGSSVYGVVGVYASDRDAFSEREASSFATVGGIAGFAVNAARNRTLLLSDTVVELTLQVSDRTDPLVAAAADVEADLAVEGLVPQDDGRLLAYLTVDGAAPTRFGDALADAETATLSRVVDDGDEGGTVEVGLGPETALGALSAHGGTVRSATFASGRGRIEVELPPEEEIRRIAGAVTRRLDAEVLAKRETERELSTTREFRDELRDRLTDRQETVLRTAFLADYFESPRGSTAEEVADALDITGSTLLHHLRASQRKLLDEFFETTRPAPLDERP